MNHRISVNRWTSALAGMAISLVSWLPVQAQESRWAKADELTAKSLINYERLWAESGCTHSGIEKTILAEDFQGTAPDGSRYSKKEAMAESPSETHEKACEIYCYFVRQRECDSRRGRRAKAQGKTDMDRHLAQTPRNLADCGCARYAH